MNKKYCGVIVSQTRCCHGRADRLYPRGVMVGHRRLRRDLCHVHEIKNKPHHLHYNTVSVCVCACASIPGSDYLHPVAQKRQKKESSVSSPTAFSPFFHLPLTLLTLPPHTTYPPPSHYLPSPVPLCCSFLNPPSPVFYLFFRTGCSSLPLLLPDRKSVV